MTHSVTPDARRRRALLDRYREDADPDVRVRAHILLLLDDGHSRATACPRSFCSSRAIDRWIKRLRLVEEVVHPQDTTRHPPEGIGHVGSLTWKRRWGRLLNRSFEPRWAAGCGN